MLIEDQEFKFILGGQSYHCALDITMGLIGGKWKVVVLWYLRGGKKRFSELKARIPDITDKMLSLQLKALEKDGLVSRTVFPEVPPRVEYELTPLGKSLEEVLVSISRWGKELARKEGVLIRIEP